MKKYNLVLVLLLLCQLAANAQNVKLINSTEQDWAGGIAGLSGENYTFTIEFSDFVSEPHPLTLWVGREAFTINTKDSLMQRNTTMQCLQGGKKISFEIKAGVSHNEYAQRQGLPTKEAQLQEMPAPPKPYKGKALLAYIYQGKTRYFEIAEIMNTLPRQDYP